MRIWEDLPQDPALDEAERLLRRYLRPEALPAALDRPVDRLGGRTLRQVAAEDPAAALRAVTNMFDLHQLDT